jgi:hypothetical protein
VCGLPACLRAGAPASQRRDRLRKFLWLIPYFITIFALRALWNLLYWFGSNPLQRYVAHLMDEGDLAAFDWAFLVGVLCAAVRCGAVRCGV